MLQNDQKKKLSNIREAMNGLLDRTKPDEEKEEKVQTVPFQPEFKVRTLPLNIQGENKGSDNA